MIYVLYKGSGCHSGRSLRKQLAELHDGQVAGGYPGRLKKLVARSGEPEFVVNLGTTDEFTLSSTFLNNRDMVKAASNKKAARKIFEEQGVAAPKLYLKAADIPESGFPVVGRTSYHSKGNGFWYCKNMRDVNQAVRNGATHFMQFIPRTREYRVHTFVKAKHMGKEGREVADFVSVKISEKVWTGEGKPNPNEPQKNHNFGWTFLGPQNRREEELNVVRRAAKESIAALKMDFGAVDVMYHVRSKSPHVLEVNSTPSLADDNSDTCRRYADRILRTLGKLKEN